MLKELCRKAFTRSLWVYHANAGACNGCDIEVIDVLTPYYDAERFGIRLVGSPRHADVVLISGPVTRQAAPALRRLLDAVPDPKLVVAVGSCAAGGGSWFDSYATTGGAAETLKVDYFIPGCPPRPEGILYALAMAMGLVPKKAAPTHLRQETLDELADGLTHLRRAGAATPPSPTSDAANTHALSAHA